MTFGYLVGDIIRITAITLISETAMRAIDQKDYSRWIKFVGISGIAKDIVEYMHYLNTHPIIETWLKASIDRFVKSFSILHKIGIG